MITLINGNLIRVVINGNELNVNAFTITLPDGYSAETIHTTIVTNIQWFESTLPISNNQTYTFPAVNGKSPCKFTFNIGDLTKHTDIGFVIEKFGKIPDTHYFKNTFKPILVTGEDGKEYTMIPSDQFK